MHLFVATELRSGRQKLDEDETLVVQKFGFERAREMVATGKICDAKTIVGLAAVSGWLDLDLASK
jgi:ADP-ribose pyrophosphatase